MTRYQNLPYFTLPYFTIEYEFTHASGLTAKYTVVVPAPTAEAAPAVAMDKMRREGTPVDRVVIIRTTPRKS